MKTLNIIGISIYLIIAVVLAVRRIQLTQAFHQNKIKEEKNIGDTVTLDIYRSGETIDIEIELTEMP